MRVAVVVRAALEAADEVARDEAVAMHANESRAELLLETRQRFLEQVLALCSTNRDVLEFRFEIDHLVDGNEHDA